MRQTVFAVVFALLSAVYVTTPAQAPSPQAPGVHKLATTLRGSGCSVAGIETGDPTKGPSIIVEKFASGCAMCGVQAVCLRGSFGSGSLGTPLPRLQRA